MSLVMYFLFTFCHFSKKIPAVPLPSCEWGWGGSSGPSSSPCSETQNKTVPIPGLSEGPGGGVPLGDSGHPGAPQAWSRFSTVTGQNSG